MVIDFNALNGNNSMDTTLDPRELFDVLPEKDDKYEEYLRDVQTEVLNKWFNENRDKKDVILKMNTGSGKTVVGLLILKSCLNEDKGPAVYVVPDNYLLQQVTREAEALGIEVTQDTRNPDFLKGEAILVINIFKLINGRSTFGVEQVAIDIGSIIVDDAHACLDIAENQFSIEIPSQTTLYTQILDLFRDSLKQQSETKLVEIEAGEPNAQQIVPFWSWNDNKTEIIKFLHKEKDNRENYSSLFFGWNLLKNNIELCNCVIGSNAIEISPKFLPIHNIPSFQRAGRRIFMSATISDDSILTSHFDIDPTSITEAITPNSSNDIGERMIITPQELNPSIKNDELKRFYKELSTTENVVVIVPSKHRSLFWQDVADHILDSESLNSGVASLKRRHEGLVIVINKYDGIDLPKSACTVLVIDGLPDVRRKIDKVEESALQGTETTLGRKIQKIEQGMGRGIRSKDDYCVVFLMGHSLVSHLYVNGAVSRFTPATKSQIDLSKQLSKQIKGTTLEDLKEVIDHSLNRNKDWIKASRGALIKVKYDSGVNFDERVVLERQAYNQGIINNYSEAAKLLSDFINKENDPILKGFLKQKMAEYIHFYDPVRAQQVLMSAVKENTQVIHPLDGIQYNRLLPSDSTQAQTLLNNIQWEFKDANKYILTVNKLIDELKFMKDTSNVFEQAIEELAKVIGLRGQRPEKQYKRGPDNLWLVGNSLYFVIECKNESTSEEISKKDCNQLNGSIQWFHEGYDQDHELVPIMIHNSNVFEYAASPNKSIKIINADRLELLKSNLRKFAQAVAANSNDVGKIDNLLKQYSFKGNDFIREYTVEYQVRRS